MKKTKCIEDLENIEYVIYCRKSTDESSGNQKQSIPDQIKACLDYAKREWLQIKKKPKDFSDFESESEIYKEDNESDIPNRRIYQESRGRFIIKEQETGKIPWKRKKWNKLMKMIDRGKIKGLISYSPDRQARNMLEGGELINFVDMNLVILRYTNFHFEKNASGKMMLGIWFVFSKQYSDKLSEDIHRANKNKLSGGSSLWRPKHGYLKNANNYHEPHPKYFSLIKEAFEMKLNGEIESKIKDFLDANWYLRKHKKPIAKSSLNSMFRDPFYYGVLINGEHSVDLREVSDYYKPVITEEQFQVLQDRYYKNPKVKNKSRIKEPHEKIRSFDRDFLLTKDGYGFGLSFPNPKRHKKKIEELRKKWINASLEDVVKPHQINYHCSNKKSKYYKLSVRMSDIDKAILKRLSSFEVWEKEFNEYVKFTNSKLDKIVKNNKEKIKYKEAEINRLKNQRDEYIKNNMSIKKTELEEKIYKKEIQRYEKKIDFLRKEIPELDKKERSKILELEMFINLLNNAGCYYSKTDYVQKGKIAKILFSNIQIDNKKRLKIKVKPVFKPLFDMTDPVWLG